LRRRLFSTLTGFVAPSCDFFATSIERIPCSLPSRLFAFEFGDPIPNLRDAFISSGFGLSERLGSRVEPFAFRLPFGSGAPDQGQRFGVAGDPGLERFKIV
jgi:hypothetical protein